MDPERHNGIIDKITDRIAEALELLATQPRDAAQDEVLRTILDEFEAYNIELRVRRENPEWMVIGFTLMDADLVQFAQKTGLISSEEVDSDELEVRQVAHAVIANLMVGEYQGRKNYTRYAIKWIGDQDVNFSVKRPITDEIQRLFGVSP